MVDMEILIEFIEQCKKLVNQSLDYGTEKYGNLKARRAEAVGKSLRLVSGSMQGETPQHGDDYKTHLISLYITS